MITQEKFDKAYSRLMELRDNASRRRQEFFSNRVSPESQSPDYYKAYGRDRAYTHALAVLEDANREE